MNIGLGLFIGISIAFWIAIIRSSRELQELDQRPSYNNITPAPNVPHQAAREGGQAGKETKVIYASRAPINNFRKLIIIVVCLVSIVIGVALSIEGLDDIGFLIGTSAGLLVFSSPIIGVSAYFASRANDAIRTKTVYLEFHAEGMICHSRVCGPVQEILWTDITEFTPILPALGAACSIQIEHKTRDKTKIAQSRYLVNIAAIELAQFVSLLERYTGLETKLPHSVYEI